MSKFEVPVIRIKEVYDHPNADRLSIVKFGDYNCISGKLEDGSHRYKVGDLAVYVPEAALVPEWLLRMGFWDEAKGRGMLAGSKGDRVKAVKLRGIISQGIMFPVTTGVANMFPLGNPDEDGTEWLPVEEGQDIAAELGITKYEPPIPSSMDGEVSAFFGHTLNFDIENIKRYPDIIQDGEEVVFTEKTHGTFCQIGFVPDKDLYSLDNDTPEKIDFLFSDPAHPNEGWFVTSKGLGQKGLVFKNVPENDGNVYVKMLKKLIADHRLEYLRNDMYSWLQQYTDRYYPTMRPFYLLGEIFGKGVQDLQYGKHDLNFAAFDLYIGDAGKGHYSDHDEMKRFMSGALIDMVPVLYTGPFSKTVLAEHTSGPTVIGEGAHIREGLVVRPKRERRSDIIGRVILKSVSDAYLDRKGTQTEFN